MTDFGPARRFLLYVTMRLYASRQDIFAARVNNPIGITKILADSNDLAIFYTYVRLKGLGGVRHGTIDNL